MLYIWWSNIFNWMIVIFILKGKQRNEKIISGNTNNENEPCVLLKGVLNNEELNVLVTYCKKYLKSGN